MPVKARESRFTIGRAKDNDLVLADDSVSRKHAELTFLPSGGVLVVDCRSSHGTTVIERGQARKISQELVGEDASIRFGDVTMSVREIADALARKDPAFRPDRLSPRPEGERGGAAWAKGSRLIRCSCGAVKRKGGPCQDCGEV